MTTTIAAAPTGFSLDAAFDYCRDVAHHYENFPVGSIMLPREMRRYFYSIYAFARTADDYADEPGYADEERLRLLAEWEDELALATQGRSQHPVFIALAETVRKFNLPTQLFRDLLTAFRSDVTTHRYDTFEDVLSYCRCSANPIGRLILRLFDYRSPELDQWSDDICTALQLANFWQDLSLDLSRGRIYIAQEDLQRFDYSVAELLGRDYNDRFIKLLRYQVDRTQQLFYRGRPLCKWVGGRLSLELRAVWLGGMRILEKIDRNGYNVFDCRPIITALDKLTLVGRFFTWVD